MSEALVHALVALIDSRIAAHGAQTPTPAPTPAPTPTPTPAADPFGIGTTAGTAAPAIEVTPKMIQELIIPLISNEAAKGRLQQVMQSMGINELPAARPDQLPALYTAFKAISDEFNGAAASPAAGGVTLI